MTQVNEVPENKGKVVEIDGRKAAIFNNQGDPKAFSTTCPHLGCDVEWNDSENSWDCPCHGSRFNKDGSLLKGPARRGLDPIETEIKDGEIKLK